MSDSKTMKDIIEYALVAQRPITGTQTTICPRCGGTRCDKSNPPDPCWLCDGAKTTNYNPIIIMTGDKFEDMVRAYAAVVTDAGMNPLDEIRVRLSAAIQKGKDWEISHGG